MDLFVPPPGAEATLLTFRPGPYTGLEQAQWLGRFLCHVPPFIALIFVEFCHLQCFPAPRMHRFTPLGDEKNDHCLRDVGLRLVRCLGRFVGPSAVIYMPYFADFYYIRGLPSAGMCCSASPGGESKIFPCYI